ncbi:MAG: hypothetical protein ACE5J2_09140 [Nitrososphaerales archaeon]
MKKFDNEFVKDLKGHLPIEAKEAEKFFHLTSTCEADIPKLFFKILLYDSMLHSEIIGDLIRMLSTRDAESLYKECVSYVKAHIDEFRDHVKEEENALKEAELRLKETTNAFVETLFQHMARNEESHTAMLKVLVKEAKTQP